MATTERLTNFRNAVLHVEPSARWVRGVFSGVTVVDSKHVILVRSQAPRRGRPTYYFPVEDVRMDLLEPSGKAENDRHLGHATYLSLTVGDRTAADAAWSFGEPFATEDVERSDAPDLRGYVALAWDALDHWFEEAEEIFRHPRDPYKRVDCILSTRRVRIVVDGETVADTQRPVLLFETGLRTRYYIPKIDVRMDLLRDSATHTACPYKGTASYYSLDLNGKLHEDIAWYYPQALPEAMRIAGGYISFYDERVEAVEVD